MKIVRNNSKYTLEEIKSGDVFEYDSEVYIKIRNECDFTKNKNEVTCIRLDDGLPLTLANWVTVKPLEAILKINEAMSDSGNN